LAYQPSHCFSAAITGGFRFLSWELQSRYTGARTTNDIHDILPGYLLWNLFLAGTTQWGEQKFTLQVMFNNLFNKDYQNVKFYAMPGRNFFINLHIHF
jgi:iron complex outermembrane receptor protein